MQDPDAGKRIRQIRQRLGLTQAQFAKRIGVIQVSVARYEAGRIPRAEVLDRIARVGRVNAAWLLRGEGAEESGLKEDLPTGDLQIPRSIERFVAFIAQRVAALGDLPRSYRTRYDKRINELITRIERDLEEYQKMLRVEYRARKNRGSM